MENLQLCKEKFLFLENIFPAELLSVIFDKFVPRRDFNGSQNVDGYNNDDSLHAWEKNICTSLFISSMSSSV